MCCITVCGIVSVTRQLPPDPDHYEPLWDGRAPLFQLLERRRLDLAAAHNPQADDLYARLATVRLKLSRALLSPRGASAEDISRLTTQKEDLEKELASRLNLHRPSEQTSASPALLSAALPAGCVLRADVPLDGAKHSGPDAPLHLIRLHCSPEACGTTEPRAAGRAAQALCRFLHSSIGCRHASV